jgi:hypothetical protein
MQLFIEAVRVWWDQPVNLFWCCLLLGSAAFAVRWAEGRFEWFRPREDEEEIRWP